MRALIKVEPTLTVAATQDAAAAAAAAKKYFIQASLQRFRVGGASRVDATAKIYLIQASRLGSRSLYQLVSPVSFAFLHVVVVPPPSATALSQAGTSLAGVGCRAQLHLLSCGFLAFLPCAYCGIWSQQAALPTGRS